MRPARLSVFLFCFAIWLAPVCPARAQSTEADIFARLHDHPLFLRGFWAEDNLHFDAEGKPEKLYKTDSFTVCGFRADTVRVTGDHLHIEGARVGLVFDEQGLPRRTVLMQGRPGSPEEVITIDVDNDGHADLKPALDSIFADGFAKIAPSLPSFWEKYLQKHGLGRDVPVSPTSAPRRVDGTSPPVLTSELAAEYSGFAKRAGLSGSVIIYLNVEADGKPSNIQILQPLGLGLDENAVNAASNCRFKPAKLQGHPVRAELYMEIPVPSH